ncbi:MAG: sarcosine oxidase subunit gamma [Chloroflexi bacterium]|nr:sarcosine oxidase subunit gamma [Chloroflexota bacterium]
MTDSGLRARSPLEGATLAIDSTSTLGIRELPFLVQVGLRADPADEPLMSRLTTVLGARPPTDPNTTSISEDGTNQVLWLGPDEWLVLGEPGTAGALESKLRSALDAAAGAVVDLSANRTAISVSGPRARESLAFGCAIDLEPPAFGPGRCAQTLLARANVIIVPVGPADEPAFRILVRPSFAGYLATWLVDAAVGLD